MQDFEKLIFRDEALSWAAKGMMAYLLSLDEDEPPTIKGLIGAGPAGAEAVSKIVKELEAAGYIKRECRNEGGRFVWSIRLLGRDFSGDPPADNPGYVYVYGSGRRFRIGKTANLSAGTEALLPGAAEDMEVAHAIASTDHGWAQRQLHKRFEKKRVEGEWFALTGPDLEWLTSKERYDPPRRDG
jgi:hypothetical protein